MEHEPLRYAHDEGLTDVCFSEDAQHYITCGADGDIRIWSLHETQDPIHICVGEWATSVRQKGKHLYVATASNDIQILSYPEGERDGVLQRFVAPVNQIVLSKKHDYMAIASEDMQVKVLDLSKTENEVITFTGLTGPCLSVALSLNCELIAASSGDGKLRIWNIESKELIKEIECFPKVNSFSNASILCRIDFEPTKSKILAYPNKNNVVLLNTNDWSQKLLSSEAIDASYSLVQYSPCGKYIIAASNEGDFAIFDSLSETVLSISKHANDTSISGLAWNYMEPGKIVYTDIEGQLGIIKCSLKTEVEIDDIEFDENEIIENGDNTSIDGKVNFDDDEDDENVISVEKLKKQYLPDDDLEPELKFDENSSHAPTPRARTPEIPQQAAFMPSSTPEHLNPRYLCWNDVGIIKCYGSSTNSEETSKSIEVEFHDSTFHNSLMIQNYQDYHLGSLSKESLIIANSSQINVIPLSASSNEWILKVEEPEEIILVTSSENLLCFGLNNNLVRVCSTYGTQRAVISIPGPLISMNAYKNILLVAYHTAGVCKGNQYIGIKYIKFDGMTFETKDLGSSLSPEATMLWLGFSDIGTPAIMDSFGILCLYPLNCNIWIPYCNTLKSNNSVADGFFVTSVFESCQAVAGIKCRGSLYPGFIPRPTVCELLLEPMFAETETEKTQMESNLFTWSTLQVNDIEKKYKETALKTFVLACKNNLDYRAVEFMELLSNPQILTLGIKYASKLEKKRLAEKLIDLATKITNEDNCDTFEKKSVPDVQIKQPLRKLTLNSSKYALKNKTQTKNTPKEVPSPIVNLEESQSNSSILDSTANTTINTQESLFIEETPRNPFLKKLQTNKPTEVKNPLSLVDKFAGIEYEMNSKENIKNNSSEKRKHPDSADAVKPKEKQRKLDMFKFSKNS